MFVLNSRSSHLLSILRLKRLRSKKSYHSRCKISKYSHFIALMNGKFWQHCILKQEVSFLPFMIFITEVFLLFFIFILFSFFVRVFLSCYFYFCFVCVHFCFGQCAFFVCVFQFMLLFWCLRERPLVPCQFSFFMLLLHYFIFYVIVY